MNWTLFFLIISLIFNVLLAWYIVKMIKRVLTFQERLDEFVDGLVTYEGHIDVVSNLETYYGDETLTNLLRHSKAIVEECQDFRALYYGEDLIEFDDDNELEILDGS